MEVTWLRRSAFLVMGTVTRLPQSRLTTPALERIWRDFESHQDQILPLSTDRAYYGVRFTGESREEVEYQAGMAVRKAHTTPAGLMVREIPAARYAVFRCLPGKVEETCRAILQHWLPGSGEARDPQAPLFEQYPPLNAADPYVLVHLPVRD